MKKLIFVFAVLVALVIVAGCNARRNGGETIKFNPKIEGVTEETATVVVPADEPASKKPLELKADLPPNPIKTSSLPSSGPGLFVLLGASVFGGISYMGIRRF
ncbi:hypothetical protein JXA05_02055, partial [Candidatus Peregrinibacteria bacterium]|nr:hypothetical protein [Candidatus Peregrinibacteria bacterium]